MKPIVFNRDELWALVRGQPLDLLVDKLNCNREIPVGPWYHRRYFDEWQKAVGQFARSRPNGRLHFGRAVIKLREWIDGEATVVLDAGSHEIWARTILPSHGPLSFIGSGNWGGMGYALPGLIGARLAVPDRRAVAITGDGCLLMSIADLSTLAEVGGRRS